MGKGRVGNYNTYAGSTNGAELLNPSMLKGGRKSSQRPSGQPRPAGLPALDTGYGTAPGPNRFIKASSTPQIIGTVVCTAAAAVNLGMAGLLAADIMQEVSNKPTNNSAISDNLIGNATQSAAHAGAAVVFGGIALNAARKLISKT